MSRFILPCIVIVLLVPAWSRADVTAQIKQLQQRIKDLKAQRTVLIKDTEARYKTISKAVRLSEEERGIIRRALLAEELQVLALTADPAVKQKIRDQYETVRAVIRTGVRLDEAARQKLVAQGKAQVLTIRVTYEAQIDQLENQIQALRIAKSVQPKSKKK